MSATNRASGRWFGPGELMRVLLFSAVALVGFGFIYGQYLRSQRAEAERAAAAAASGAPIVPLPPAETGPDFDGIRDREVLTFSDSAAYARLLEWSRTRAAGELESAARRDILFRQIVERPARYRGIPIHVEGTAVQVARLDDIPPALSPSGVLYEAWVTNRGSQGYPYCLVFEELPKGIEVGTSVRIDLRFDGFFFKLLAYEGTKDGGGALRRYAPLFVGRVAPLVAPSDQTIRSVGIFGMPNWAIVLIAVVLGYLLIRWWFWLRGQFAPRPHQERPTIVNDAISAAELQEWLERGGREASADE
jgi:hypothetical protein